MKPANSGGLLLEGGKTPDVLQYTAAMIVVAGTAGAAARPRLSLLLLRYGVSLTCFGTWAPYFYG